MKGVLFGGLHSFRDLGLILTGKEIGAPTVKVSSIDIPGGDGVIDLTEYFGGVKYGNRRLSFEFSTILPQRDFMEQFASVQNALHGQKMQISLDADAEWYYTGRVSVSPWKSEKNIGKITIDCDCDPYKYRNSAKVVHLCGRNLINLDAGVSTTSGAWVKMETGYKFTRGSEAGGSFVYFNVPVQKGVQYIFSADYTLTTRLLYVYKDRLYGTLVEKAQSGQPCIFTPDKTGIYTFGLYIVAKENSGVFENVMLQEGTETGAYEAYDATEKEITVAFNNTRKSAIPSMRALGSVTVESDSNFATLSDSSQSFPEFTLSQGETALTFKGNGYAVVEWKEGGL